MGRQGILLLLLFAAFMPVQARARANEKCRNLFEKNTVDLVNAEYWSVTVAGTPRDVLIFQPTQASRDPAPVMIYFHGTNYPVETSRPLESPFGLAYENAYIQSLTDAGFVVIAPTANRIVPYYIGIAVVAWEANISPYSGHFTSGRDYRLTEYLLQNLENFSVFNIDRKNIFISGFSSGGYMSSRLIQETSIAKYIRGIVVHSASYGECLASQCYIPSNLPASHPPTFLVANKDDSIVPFSTVELYQARLRENNIPVETQFSNDGDHAWNKNHGAEITKWLKKQLQEN